MNAVAITTPGGPEVLNIAALPTPKPAAGQLLVKVAAAGVNRPDLAQRAGAYPPPPGHSPLPGLEIAGEVVEAGADTTRWKPGDKVCALVNGGGYAEYCIAEETAALPIPAGLDMVRAAALPETFFTVWNNVFERGRLTAGEWFLVHGGSSGIGTTAIQLAKAFGAHVIATAGSPDKCQACLDLGADRAVNYRMEDFVAVAKLNLARLMMKRLTLTGSTLRPRTREVKAGFAHALEEKVWPLLAAGKVKVVMDSTFPLTQAAEAHRRVESSQHIGKVVLTV
jgi:NADPH2:quinone reductase